MLGYRSTILVAPRIGVVQHQQRRSQIGDVQTLVLETGVPSEDLSSPRDVKEDGIQQEGKIAVLLEHTLQ